MPLTDLSSLKAPGWQRIVADLSAPAPDDRVFLLRLVSVLGQVSGARQAVLFTFQGQRESAPELEPRPTLVWPLGPDVVDEQGRMTVPAEAIFDPARVSEAGVESLQEAKAAARAAASSRQSAIFGLDGESQMYDPQGSLRGYIIGVPIASGMPAEAPGLPLHGVVTLLLDARSRQAVQTTLALVEVLTGYAFMHATGQALRRTRAGTAALDLAARLIAAVNATPDFKGCALQFVNDLARQLGVDRVALGWLGGGHPQRSGVRVKREARCVALSDTENIDRRMAMIVKIEAAMDECLDQEQPVLFPPPPEQNDAVLSQAITHAHRELAAGDARLKVASLPLRLSDAKGERILGVVLVESGGDGRIDTSTVELLQATLDLVAPVLAVRHSDDRAIPLRIWDWMVKTAAWAVGPTHTVWKAAGVLVLAGALFMTFFTTTYRVGAPTTLIPRERRVISMPFDGVISRIGENVEPGRSVKADQLLVELDTREMILGQLEADAQITQFDKQADEALKKQDFAQATQLRARADQSRARRDLLASQAARSRLVSPIDGTITAGDLKDKVGASIKLGEKLFEVADVRDMIVVARVDDRDISLVRVGATGEFSPKSDPSRTIPFVVEQIVPQAKAEEGENIFEVRARFDQSAGDTPIDWALAGLEGQARFNTERRSLAWIASRRIVDTLRVWLWW